MSAKPILIKMKIRYFAMVRDATGKSEEEWNAPAATLGVLVRDLIARYGADLQKWVMEKGEMNGLSIILVNGRDARHHGVARDAVEAG